MVTALSGAGMTGSYIFSQTIFSMRAGVKTRIHGIIIAGDTPLYCCQLHFCPLGQEPSCPPHFVCTAAPAASCSTFDH